MSRIMNLILPNRTQLNRILQPSRILLQLITSRQKLIISKKKQRHLTKNHRQPNLIIHVMQISVNLVINVLMGNIALIRWNNIFFDFIIDLYNRCRTEKKLATGLRVPFGDISLRASFYSASDFSTEIRAREFAWPLKRHTVLYR